MFDELSPPEITTLRLLGKRGAPISEVRLDADALRALAHRRLVRRMSGFAVITPEGRRALDAMDAPPATAHMGSAEGAPADESPAREGARAEAEDGEVSLNSTQEDMLRQLAQSEAPVPFDDLDGRVVRALEGRGLVQRTDGLVSVTEAGQAFYRDKVRRRRRARSGWVRTVAERAAEEPGKVEQDRAARAKSIREAVDVLRRAIPSVDPVAVGDLEAPADDAFTSLLELADRIERGADPKRITRR